MKKIILLLLTGSLLATGCGTTQPERTGAIIGGAAIGNSVGGAIGGLVGDSRHGWRGSYRGSAIGSIVGTLAGAAIGGALTTPRTRDEKKAYPIEQVYAESEMRQPSLHIRNLRFIDDDRNHALSAGESSKIIFEVMNEGTEPVYNVIPSVTETSGVKHLHISPSILVEEILPGNGIKYTATVSVGKRIKNGTATFQIAVTDHNGYVYDQQEFTLNTIH